MITEIFRITDTTCQQAEYVPNEGRLTIPKLTINNKTYKATLKKISENIFKIEAISPI